MALGKFVTKRVDLQSIETRIVELPSFLPSRSKAMGTASAKRNSTSAAVPSSFCKRVVSRM
jgi:hypothetical protein